MNVTKSFICVAVIAAMALVSCKKPSGSTVSESWTLSGYSILDLEDQDPVNMTTSTIVAYIGVPASENQDVEFGFFLSPDPSVPEGNRTKVIWDSKMKTSRYDSAYEIKGTFRDLDCNKTYYYTVYYSLDGHYRTFSVKSFIPGCVEFGPDFKWAVCNLGAADRYAYGDYYAWGETSPKKAFTSGNYKGSSATCTGYALNREYDAVSQTLGGSWRLPSDDAFRKLRDDTKFEWTNDNGWFKVTSKIEGYEGNCIYLPKSGMMNDITESDGTSNAGKNFSASYLSSTYSMNSYVYILYCGGSAHEMRTEKKYYGFPVRPYLAD